ncbi:M14 family metallopeptidase [Candidatus Zixiibacteriota bacterium]
MLHTARRVLILLAAVIAVPSAASAQPVVPVGDLPLTVAEASDFTRTATFDDVWNWVEDLQALGAAIHVTSTGLTTEGRAMPLVTISRPLVTSPAEAHASGKPIIYLQGNIHAGEVEGKDALLMLMRDVTVGGAKEVLENVILLINPIFNADGNEMWGPVERNRRGQDGPVEVGLRPNGMGLDLNRDFIKAEAPETRGALSGVLNTWRPHLFMDLHTTNGSYHGYDLTYAAAMTPTAPRGPVDYTNDVLLPEIQERVAGHGHALFDYGNHGRGYPPTTWSTFGWQPRYASNYMGMRGMISILSEAVSYRSFRTRLSATYWFVRETVDFAGRNAGTILDLTRRAEEEVVGWGVDPENAPELGVRFELVSRGQELVSYEVSEASTDPAARGRRVRTGLIEEALMDVFSVFKPVATRPYPAGYIIPVAYPEAVEVLLRHGVAVEQLERSWSGSVQTFRVDSLAVAQRPYQGHRNVTVWGDYSDSEREVPAGWYFISTAQPLGALVFTMLEPEIEDSLFTWNYFDRTLSARRDVPVLKVMSAPAVPRSRISAVIGR